MPSKRTSNPRVRIHATGIATLSGFNYDDLRSILTSAWLNTHDGLQKAKKNGDSAENVQWYEEQLAFLDMAKSSMDAAIIATNGPPRPPTKKDRLAKVRADIAFRRHMDAFFAELDAQGAAQ